MADGPAALIHFVDALVADVAAAGWPDPVPIVVEVFAHERLHGSGAAPEVVVDAGGDGLGAAHFTDAGARLIAEAASVEDFAEFAALKILDQFAIADIGTALGAVLDDAVIFGHGFDALAAFPDVVADGLFDVDILAGLAGPDGDQGVPVIGSGGGDGDDVFVLEEVADIFVADDFVALLFLVGDALFEDVLIGITEGGEADVLLFTEGGDVGLAAGVEADDGDADGLVGADGAEVGGEHKAGAGGGGAFEEKAARETAGGA